MKNVGHISLPTGQLLLAPAGSIESLFSEASGEGIMFCGAGSQELAQLLVDEVGLVVERLNNWYRIKGELGTSCPTVQQMLELSTSHGFDIYCETLRGDKRFDDICVISESAEAAGIFSDSTAVAAYMGEGLYQVHTSETRLVISAPTPNKLMMQEIGTLMISGALLGTDPTSIRLRDWSREEESAELYAYISDLSNAGGGQLTFNGFKNIEYSSLITLTPGEYRVIGHYDVDESGLRTYRTVEVVK